MTIPSKPLTITIDCPMVDPGGGDCDGTLTVQVTGRRRPARGFDPPECLEYEITGQTCQCDPLAIDSTKAFWDRMEDAICAAGEASR